MAKQTPLYDQHIASGAHTIDFHGWLMPLHYGSQLNEHHAVRNAAGLFDISHMTIVDVSGCDAREFLRYLLANDIARMSRPGTAQYSLMLNDNGGVIDDLIIYFLAENHYRLILNAATRDKDIAWLKKHRHDFDISLDERPDLALLSLQGPQSADKLKLILSPPQRLEVAALQPFQCHQVDDWFIATTGYTGEAGYEISLPVNQAIDTWQTLIDEGIQAIGLGARDSLRLEAGMNLYGQDMDEHTSPYDANLGWTVALEPADRRFIGREAVSLQKQQHQQQLVGLVMTERGVMRNSMPVSFNAVDDGLITSGTYSPTLGCSIALARAPRQTGNAATITLHGKEISVRVTRPAFVRHGRALNFDAKKQTSL